MNHLLITGLPGVGKTTLLQRALEQLKNVPATGFVTEEVRQSGDRVGFDVVTLTGGRAPLARVGAGGGRSRPCVGRYAVDLESFERVALSAMASAPSGGVLVIDEIGKMELLSAPFQRSVRAAFAGGAAVIVATVPVPRGRQPALLAELRSRPDIRLLEVTRQNREALVQTVTDFVLKRLGNGGGAVPD
ncbi:cancer-related nucleoside-triphosphatase homolog [Pollicipes pollicipes]|uniref:cancer-related nucleoside-triphosphatase homolog n=1 Tax=Pollicipes pollicipes TaxID=41117 RepID=UPI00188568A4|nr:cancer-related nucleoside-triphosphatase homolog [Pollicipes pollicipes]